MRILPDQPGPKTVEAPLVHRPVRHDRTNILTVRIEGQSGEPANVEFIRPAVHVNDGGGSMFGPKRQPPAVGGDRHGYELTPAGVSAAVPTRAEKLGFEGLLAEGGAVRVSSGTQRKHQSPRTLKNPAGCAIIRTEVELHDRLVVFFSPLHPKRLIRRMKGHREDRTAGRHRDRGARRGAGVKVIDYDRSTSAALSDAPGDSDPSSVGVESHRLGLREVANDGHQMSGLVHGRKQTSVRRAGGRGAVRGHAGE